MMTTFHDMPAYRPQFPLVRCSYVHLATLMGQSTTAAPGKVSDRATRTMMFEKNGGVRKMRAAAANQQDRQSTQRADARRNREAIVDAAVGCLGRNPETPVGDIAREAGVGRVTLYGHFANRSELVDAAFVRAMEQGDAALAEVDLTGDPVQALRRLIESSWELVERSRALLIAAQKVLPPARIRELHAQPAARVLGLITRGQEADVFRTDLPASWLVSSMHSVMHGAAEEVTAGRLRAVDAARCITEILVPAFTATSSPAPA